MTPCPTEGQIHAVILACNDGSTIARFVGDERSALRVAELNKASVIAITNKLHWKSGDGMHLMQPAMCEPA
jgi:hypothetical protein